jgi:hypothetical protein
MWGAQKLRREWQYFSIAPLTMPRAAAALVGAVCAAGAAWAAGGAGAAEASINNSDSPTALGRSSSSGSDPTPYYPVVADVELDCAVREAAYNFSLALQPERGAGLDVFDALELSSYCGVSRPSPRASSMTAYRFPPTSSSGPSFYCDAAAGNDLNPGTESDPFATVQAGVEACRSASVGSAGCTVVLRDSSPFVLRAPLALSAGLDDYLTLTAYPGESPVLTGAWPLEGAWEPLNTTASNVWVMRGAGAGLPLGLPQALLPPTADAADRFFRARYPNGDLEADLVPDGYTNASRWLPPTPPSSPPVSVPVSTPNRPWDFYFPNFTWATGGTALGNFEPPEGYWIHQAPPGGVPWNVPSGFVYDPAAFSPRAAQWGNLTGSGAVVRAFHGEYWGSWLIEVASHDAATGTLTFGRGGWQEARGWPTGGALYIENVLAELDAPGEWHMDAATGDLVLFANGTAGTPPVAGLAAAQLETLIAVTGSAPSAPSVGVKIVGLTLTGTAPTYLTRPFRAPSGGDWSFANTAAVIVEGALNFTLDGCTLDRLGGNGLLLRGWNQGATVTGSTFTRLGDSAIVSAGLSPALSDLSQALAPVGTTVEGCRFSKLGLHVKQSGAYYGALSANLTFTRNVAFNLPRAAVNINDGAFGGHLLSRNLFFSCVQETADHAAVNTWNRDAFLQPDGSLTPLPIRSEGNFLINNFYSIHPLDHDDGSFATVDTGNVLAFAGTKNFEGFNKVSTGNLIVRPDFMVPTSAAGGVASAAGGGALAANPVTPSGVPLPVAYYFPACARSVGQHAWGVALADVYENNTCILAQPSPFLFGECTPSAPGKDGLVPLTGNNTYRSPGGNLSISCGGKTLSLAEAQAAGYEVGSTATDGSTLSPSDIAALIRVWLSF